MVIFENVTIFIKESIKFKKENKSILIHLIIELQYIQSVYNQIPATI